MPARHPRQGHGRVGGDALSAERQVQAVDVSPRAPATHPRLGLIDLLRFVAAVMVLLYHFTFAAPAFGLMDERFPSALTGVTRFGYLGVDLFFMISGFVVFMSALGRRPSQFVISRLSRLYPGYWVAVTLTTLVVVVLGFDRTPSTAESHASMSLQRWAVNMTMLQDMVGVPPVDGAYWSLAYELCFYAMLFIIMLIGLNRTSALVFMLLWQLVSVAERLEVLPGPVTALVDKVMLPAYSHYFIAGMALYLLGRGGRKWIPGALLASSLGLALLLANERAGYVSELTEQHVDGIGAMAIVLVFFLVMAFVTLSPSRSTPAWFASLGALTYPLYLVHGVIGFALFDKLDGRLPLPFAFVVVTATVATLAWCIQRFVEQPLQPRMRRTLTQLVERFSRVSRARRATESH